MSNCKICGKEIPEYGEYCASCWELFVLKIEKKEDEQHINRSLSIVSCFVGGLISPVFAGLAAVDYKHSTLWILPAIFSLIGATSVILVRYYYAKRTLGESLFFFISTCMLSVLMTLTWHQLVFEMGGEQVMLWTAGIIAVVGTLAGLIGSRKENRIPDWL